MPTSPRSRTLAVVLLVSIGLTACRLFTTPGHDTATIEVESNVPTSVMLITSDNFVRGADIEGTPVFHLFNADTTWVELPFAQDFSLRTTGLFYVRVAESEDPAAVVSFRAFIDGQLNFAHEAVIQMAGIQYYYEGIR